MKLHASLHKNLPATKPSYNTPQSNVAATLNELIPNRRVWIFGSLYKKFDSSGSENVFEVSEVSNWKCHNI